MLLLFFNILVSFSPGNKLIDKQRTAIQQLYHQRKKGLFPSGLLRKTEFGRHSELLIVGHVPTSAPINCSLLWPEGKVGLLYKLGDLGQTSTRVSIYTYLVDYLSIYLSIYAIIFCNVVILCMFVLKKVQIVL